MRVVFRILALVALVLAVMAGVIDAIQSVAAKAVVLTPLSAAWQDVSPSTLAALRTFTDSRLPPAAGEVFLPLFLAQPAAAVLLAIAFVLHILGYRPRGRVRRFSRR